MGYSAFKSNRRLPVSKVSSFWASNWIDKVVAPELLGQWSALTVKNCRTIQDWFLEKTWWASEVIDLAIASSSMLKEFSDDIWMIWYWDKLATLELSTQTLTVLKTFAGTWDFDGKEYATDFFYSSNWSEKLNVFYPWDDTYKFITFSSLTADFTIWSLLTWAWGATWIIRNITNLTATTWVLLISNITWVFVNPELITDWSWWSATSSSLTTDYYVIESSTKCDTLHKNSWRLFINDLDKPWVVNYCEKDNLESIPFLIWTTTNEPPFLTDSSSLDWQDYWNVKSITNWGSQLVTWFENWKAWSRITWVDVYNVWLAQKVETDWEYSDYWMNRGALNSTKGLFYTNERWIHRLYSWWNTTQPFSIREDNLTEQVFPKEFMDKIDFTDNDLIYDDVNNIVYITCRQESSFNNFIFWYKIDKKAFFTVEWLQVKRFMKVDENIYWISSITWQIFELFNSNEQDGVSTSTEFEYEVPWLWLNLVHTLNTSEIKWFFHPDWNVKMIFDKYDQYWVLKRWFATYSIWTGWITPSIEWLNQVNMNNSWIWWAQVDWWVVETMAKNRTRIWKFTRLRVRIVSNDNFYHKINYINLNITTKWENKIKSNLI